MKDRKFLTVRHGHTDLNAGSETSVDKERGWSDVPLNEEGIAEAEVTAKKLKGKGIQALVCSDLKRAKQTADIISKATGVPVTASPLFRPWDLGNLTGKSTKESAPKLKYFVNHPKETVPQGESFDAFRKRMFSGLREALDQSRGKLLCIVTHRRCERLIASWIKNGQKPDLSVDLKEFMAEGEDPADFEEVTIDESKIGAGGERALVGALSKAMNA